ETEEERKLIALKARLTDATRPMIGNLSSVLEYYNTKKRGAIMRGGAAADDKKKKGKAESSSSDTTTTTGETDATNASAPEGADTAVSAIAETKTETAMAKIYLGGAGTYVKGIKELIENEFNGIEVIVLQRLPGVNIAKDNRVAEEHSTELIACIGSSFPTISFYEKSAKEALSKTLIISIVGLVAVIAAAVVIILNGKSEYDKALERKGTLIGQRDALEAQGIEQLETEYNDAMVRYASIVAADLGTFNYNEKWNDILSYLETESVKNISVSSITSTPTDLTMNIVVSNKDEAAKLLLQFQNIPYFSNISINGITESIDDQTGVSTVSFSLKCDYKLPDSENAGN
ncbi:MAG: hypothetical protein J5824_04660, partial [Lachnospiraceae bacterium]|nr:hypothetical protein [Lachnospiraceae bacterium]